MGERKIQILLVEDDEAHAELVRRAFTARYPDATLRVAETLRDARAFLAISAPDLLITDYVLPDGRGLELLAGPGIEPSFPAIVMTSHGDEELAVEAMKSGALDYLVKSEATLSDMPHIAMRALREWDHILRGREIEEEKTHLHEMLESLWGLAKLVESDLEALCNYVLHESVERTQSQHGFYGFMNPDESVMTLHAWSEDFMADYRIRDKPVHFRVENAGLWAHALRHRRPVVFNDCKMDIPAKKGIPMGHVPLSRLMSIPVFAEGRIVALGVVGNKETDYTDEEARQLQAFMTNAQILIERKRAVERAAMQQQQLLLADKMASLGILVSGVAHEINNPNHFITSQTPILARAWDSIVPVLEQYYEEHGDFDMGGIVYSEMRERVPDILSSILRGANRIKAIVGELKQFARESPPGMSESVRLGQVIEGALTLMSSMMKKATAHFSVDIGKDLPVIHGNSQQIEQVIVNLLQNACQALSNEEEAIHLRAYLDAEANTVVVEVEDQGVGMSEETLTRVTDPFYTTKRDSGGTGLGLAISSRIIIEHGGSLSFSSTPGVGTKAMVTLPVAPGAEEPR